MGKFDEQVVLITGASAGIGKALALQFAREGAHLVLTARRKERLEALAKEIEGLGRKALAIACDVNVDGDLERAVEETHKELGKLNVVVANAGFGVAGTLEGLTLDDFRRQFETNVFGVLRTLYATVQDLKDTQGRFAIVGSVNGYLSLPGNAPYGMSKFAVTALAQSLFHEYKKQGVSVTLISPGFVSSEIRQVNNKGVYKENAKDPIPSWLVMPAEVAARQITSAIYKRRRELVVTFHGKVLKLFARLFPRMLDWVLGKINVQGRQEAKSKAE